MSVADVDMLPFGQCYWIEQGEGHVLCELVFAAVLVEVSGFEPAQVNTRACTQLIALGTFWSFREDQRRCARCCGMTNGNVSSTYCQVKRQIGVSQRRTTGCSSKRFYGSPAPAVPGEIFRRSSATGITCIRASRAGARAACGNAWSKRWVWMSTWRRCCWIAPLFVPTSMLLAPKKRRHASNRALARRTDYQDPHGCGRVGQSRAMAAYGR